MKILFVITHGNAGGAQRHVASAANGMSGRGHQVSVLVGEGDWLRNRLSSSVDVIEAKMLRRSWNPAHTLGFMKELFNLVEKNGYELVHFHSSNALLGVFGMPRKVKKIATVHGYSLMSKGWSGSILKKLVYSFVMQLSLRGMNEIIFVCKADQDAWKGKHSQLIYNGISTDQPFMERSQARAELGFTENDFVIGTIARASYAKHLDLFYEIASSVPAAKFINLSGRHEHPKVYLKALDGFVLTSRFEGFPYALLEAAVARVPMISSDVGGVSELLDQNAGVLVSPGDKAAFVRAIQDLLSRPDKARERSSNAINKVEHKFSESEMLDKLEHVYASHETGRLGDR